MFLSREDGNTAAELSMVDSEYTAGDLVRTIGGKGAKIPGNVCSADSLFFFKERCGTSQILSVC